MGVARFAFALVATLAVVLVACGGDGDDDDTGASVASPSPEKGGAECADRGRAPGTYDEALQSSTGSRTYILHIPPAYDGASPMPLVLNFHGFGSNARNQSAYSRIHAKADEAGFIAVTPTGGGQPQQWNGGLLPGGANDLPFAEELLDHLQASLCIDEGRVYAIGISNGSAFAQRVACALPGRIAGVAAVAAMVPPISCDAAGPVPLIAFHGTADRCVPYGGGTSMCGRNLPVPPVEEAALRWAEHNGCVTEPARSQVTEHVRAIEYSACQDDASVALYVVEGGGHTWPGSTDVPRLGPVTGEVDATDLLWEFFRERADR